MKQQPHVVELPAGTHFICQCGRSAKWPICDGSHHKTRKKPYKLTLKEPQRIALCSCTGTSDSPFCDGSHAAL